MQSCKIVYFSESGQTYEEAKDKLSNKIECGLGLVLKVVTLLV